MMKKLWKQNFWLLAALGAYALVSLYVYERSGIFIHRAIVWNVFLALLPYLFMTLFFAAQQRRHHLGMLAAFLCWLLLFPNVPYLITVLLYLACSNTIAPLFGFKPPTKDLNVTAALAIMSMCLIEFSGIRKNGFGHWAKHFAQPIPIVAPIMILEIVIRPLSLCMRLFGNMLAGFVVMELLKAFVPLIIPLPMNFYFDIFDGLIQAYVFVFLTSLFMNEEME